MSMRHVFPQAPVLILRLFDTTGSATQLFHPPHRYSFSCRKKFGVSPFGIQSNSSHCNKYLETCLVSLRLRLDPLVLAKITTQ